MNEYSTAHTLLEVVVGVLVLIFTILVHGAGIRAINRRFSASWARLDPATVSYWRADGLLAVAIGSLAALHLVETLLWALPIYGQGMIAGMRDSYFFVLQSYTTLGAGNVTLPDEWRLLGPIIAMSGLFTFGWTAGVLVTIMSEYGKLDRDRARAKHGEKRGKD
ncbi:MAG: two pore domain potassium channel family protein [Rhizobiaceae bacterium]|nr:two pore domain potassium channel family protein [Rhizobiaceae bacterium]